MPLNKSVENCPTCISSSKTRFAPFHRWKQRLCGATAIEYALIAAAIALAIASVVFLIGTDLVTSAFQKMATLLEAHQ